MAIVTPNHMHFPVAREFLKRGIHVICDKPLTATAAGCAEAGEGGRTLRARLFVLTHNYTGYPMVRQAREMIANGELGDIRVVQVEYAQDWLSEDLEATGQKQAAWRTDPARSGAGGSTGDIGTHAFNLASLRDRADSWRSLAPILQCFVDGRRVDDNGHVLMRFEGGARGMLWCSQVAPGNENALRLARLRHQGRSGMGAGGSELSVVHAVRRTEAPDHAGRRRLGRRPPRACRAYLRGTPKAIWKASPISIRGGAGDSRGRGGRGAPEGDLSRRCRTACRVWLSSMPAFDLQRGTAPG